MKKKAIIGLSVVIIVAGIWIIASPSKDERLIKDFLNCWFEKSEENIELYNSMMENASVIGAGVEGTPAEQAEKYAANIKKTNDAFAAVYGQYLTDSALDEFMAEQYTVSYEMFTENEEWEIDKITVRKDAEEYWFEVQLSVNEETQGAYLVQGRIQMKDGKINKILNPAINLNM